LNMYLVLEIMILKLQNSLPVFCNFKLHSVNLKRIKVKLKFGNHLVKLDGWLEYQRKLMMS